MAYTTTLLDVRSDIGIRNVSAVCNDTPEFASQVNTVTRRLMRRGGWWKTEVLMRVCFQGCRIVWPRMVGTVLGIRPCGHGGALPIRNNWWSVYGYRSCQDWGYGSASPVMFDQDTAPCYREITSNTGKYLRWNVVKRPDVGRTMRVYGFAYGGQPLQERDANNNWIPGITIIATAPFAITTVLVTKITDIKIESGMQGMSYLYQVDPATGDLLGLGEYQPGETSPAYRVSKINNVCSINTTTDEYDRKMRYADALVKVEFVPALVDEDFVMLDNLDALKLGIQALRAEEANDDVGAEVKWLKAVKELNLELRDKNPGLQTVVMTNDLSQDYCFSNPV